MIGDLIRPVFSRKMLFYIVQNMLIGLVWHFCWAGTSPNFDRTTIRHGIDADPAFDHTDIQSWISDQRMFVERTDNVVCILFQNLNDTSHPVDGIFSQFRLRAMAGDSGDFYFKPGNAFMCDDHVKHCWLGHNNRVRFRNPLVFDPQVTKFCSTGHAEFFVDSAGHNDGRAVSRR